MDSKILKALGIDPALIFLFLLVLIVILFVLYVNVTMKYNRLKSSYTTFMRGKDGKTLEESMMSGFSDVEAILKYTKQNRTRRWRSLTRRLVLSSMMHLMKWVESSVLHLQCWTIIIPDGSSMQCTAEKAVTLI